MSYNLRVGQRPPIWQGAARAGCSLREHRTPVSAKSSDCQVHMAIAMDKCTATRHVQDHTRKLCQQVSVKISSGGIEQGKPMSGDLQTSKQWQRSLQSGWRVQGVGQDQDLDHQSRWAGMGRLQCSSGGDQGRELQHASSSQGKERGPLMSPVVYIFSTALTSELGMNAVS